MFFPEFTDYILAELANEVATRPSPPINPLPCDRWIARSCLQKAIRRGEVELAHRAAANLYEHDRRGLWRHLGIIALEDVGVANVGILSQLVAAQRCSKWRREVGGEWRVVAELIRQMAEGQHCQAACDLLLRALNDPALEADRTAALEFEQGKAASALQDSSASLTSRAIAALAMGGSLASGQSLNDACGVFDLLTESVLSPSLVETCRAAWKMTRNPMALLLPLIWERRQLASSFEAQHDLLPSVSILQGVPGYALDQFTRVGNLINRAYLSEDPELRQLFARAGIPRGTQTRAFGDVLFLIEGGLLKDRVSWPEAEDLRWPSRWLPSAAALGQHLPAIRRHCEAKASQIAKVRIRHFHPPAPARRS